jgi:hypothetical protein
VTESGGQKTYLDGHDRLVARVHDNRTYDGKGSFKVYEDHGMRWLCEKPRKLAR